MEVVDFGKTRAEKDRLILLAMICLFTGILTADALVQLGFVIWILYLVPLLMSVWLSYRYSTFFTAWVVSGAILLGSLIAGPARAHLSDLPNRAVFIIIVAIVALLVWEIQNNYAVLEREIAERRTAQENLEDLTRTLERRVADRTRELSGVNEALKNDIAERMRIDRALQQANKKLNILSSVTRHDILNKITALSAYLELLKERARDSSQLDYIHKLIGTVEAIRRQIEFTRHYQDIGVKAPEWCDVTATIRNMALQLPMNGIAMNVNLDSLQVYADSLVEKVFYNLMENSLRHGEHVTEISFMYQKTGDGVVVAYTDNGVGIPAADKERIFFRGVGKHTGLGLFLAKEILGITGISIAETGTPGAGVRFEIHVPEGQVRIHRAR